MDVKLILNLVTDNYPWFGIGGSLLIIACMAISGLVYRGRNSERYSIFNHFISELGEVGVSRAAAVFNIGLILGGLAFVPFVVGLCLTIGGLLAKIGMVVGIVATLSCALVGVFPMNNLKTHYIVAVTYFRAGLLMVLLVSIAVFIQPAGEAVFPKISNLAGLLAFICYAGFLFMLRKPKEEDSAPEGSLDPLKNVERPRFWKETILEWAVFFSTILWFFILALFALE
jgi:hypothetical membrane protein